VKAYQRAGTQELRGRSFLDGIPHVKLAPFWRGGKLLEASVPCHPRLGRNQQEKTWSKASIPVVLEVVAAR